ILGGDCVHVLFSSLSVAVRLALPGIDFAELVSKLKAAHREISSIHKPGAIVQEPASGHISIRSILVQAWDARRFAGVMAMLKATFMPTRPEYIISSFSGT
ncbi:MAG: hypothetical protein JO298_04795, partial [Verrucomicrobia bacterium]|nr:hypothetical protein [Verrucomicrobiota bacterium]